MKRLTNSDIDVMLVNMKSQYERISEYKNAVTPLYFRNTNNGIVILTIFNNIKKNKGRITRIYNNNTVDVYVKNTKFIRIGDVINCDVEIPFKCKECNNIKDKSPLDIIMGYKCDCNPTKSPKLTYEIVCNRMKKFSNCEIISYDGKFVEVKCNIHNTIGKILKYDITERDNICLDCQKQEISKRMTTYTVDVVDKLLNDKNIVRLGDYLGQYHKMLVKCNECNREWKTNTACLIWKNTGCGMCNSKERVLYKSLYSKFGKNLIHHHAIHKNEKEWIVVDFFLGHKNTIIEYNGIQHYKPTRFGGCSEQASLVNFNKQIVRDTYLRDYCKNHGIRLIEIPYTVDLLKIQQEIDPIDNEEDILEKLSCHHKPHINTISNRSNYYDYPIE